MIILLHRKFMEITCIIINKMQVFKTKKLISSKWTHKIYLITILIVCAIYINLIISKPLMQEGSIDETAEEALFYITIVIYLLLLFKDLKINYYTLT
uniref:Uncharacterized protein n=1 Tax=Meloidogyne enterolobii TaxID=390850 RepID=A0A6V7X5A7_MELEN|nr:unnamed protein product [Meloidogyne enterolobii]